MSDNAQLFGRKVSLILYGEEQDRAPAMDLSQFRIQFSVESADFESPNTAVVRVFNLSQDTFQKLRKKEFANLVLNAGYENGASNFGTIFKGTIKQYRTGRVNSTSTYIDFLAADSDVGYTQAVVNKSLAKGSDSVAAFSVLADSVNGKSFGNFTTDLQHFITPPRGQVLFGMARARLREQASSINSTWSMQDGKVTILSRTGYSDGDLVELNVSTGLVGIPEQTDGGIKAKCLLNSRLKIGNQFRINQKDINQLLQQSDADLPLAFNRYAGIQYNAALATGDGFYRAFNISHEGDTRGNAWHTRITGLAISPSSAEKVDPR